MQQTPAIRAVIWDFDGTLVDSRIKNLAVTRTILERILGPGAAEIKPLRGVDAYDSATRRARHWRDLYVREFGLSPEVTEHAGRLWEEAQLEDPTPWPFFDGVPEALSDLSGVPQGVVSQNSTSMIEKALDMANLRGFFGSIIGHESVALDKQKPHPEGLFQCLRHLQVSETSDREEIVLFVGDHEVDMSCAREANRQLEAQESRLRVRSVGAFYGALSATDPWSSQPDHAAHHPQDISRLVADH